MAAPLKALRTRARYSVRDFAKLAGVSADTIWRIEAGDTPIRPMTQRKIAAALGIHPDAITEFVLPGEDAIMQALAEANKAAFLAAVEEADRDGWTSDAELARQEHSPHVAAG